MTLAPEDWRRLKDVFAGARALPASERHAYLLAACVGNEALRQEVESLLASYHAVRWLMRATSAIPVISQEPCFGADTGPAALRMHV